MIYAFQHLFKKLIKRSPKKAEIPPITKYKIWIGSKNPIGRITSTAPNDPEAKIPPTKPSNVLFGLIFFTI